MELGEIGSKYKAYWQSCLCLEARQNWAICLISVQLESPMWGLLRWIGSSHVKKLQLFSFGNIHPEAPSSSLLTASWPCQSHRECAMATVNFFYLFFTNAACKVHSFKFRCESVQVHALIIFVFPYRSILVLHSHSLSWFRSHTLMSPWVITLKVLMWMQHDLIVISLRCPLPLLYCYFSLILLSSL